MLKRYLIVLFRDNHCTLDGGINVSAQKILKWGKVPIESYGFFYLITYYPQLESNAVFLSFYHKYHSGTQLLASSVRVPTLKDLGQEEHKRTRSQMQAALCEMGCALGTNLGHLPTPGEFKTEYDINIAYLIDKCGFFNGVNETFRTEILRWKRKQASAGKKRHEDKEWNRYFNQQFFKKGNSFPE